MKTYLSPKKLFGILLFLWFCLNLVQAIYTEINPDEAYYSLYGKNLAWGYFDHPPFVALSTHLSALFFKGNMGVRFFTILLQLFTLTLTYKLIDQYQRRTNKEVMLFFLIAASMPMFAAYGFITTPDCFLLFFTAIFLFIYKSFLERPTYTLLLLLGITMAGLAYSKYQGILLIVFVVLSNIKLLTNPKFLTACLIAGILCLPHIYWQFENNFPSFTYHLISRASPFKLSYFLEYLPNQLAVFNPFVFIAIVWVLFKYRPNDQWYKTLYYIIIGFVGFFWIMSFRGHAEPHWTVAASIPIMVLLNDKLTVNIKLKKFIGWYVGSALVLVMLLRVLLMSDVFPEDMELGRKKKYFEALESVAQNKPVVFSSSFQEPSLYSFFSGLPSTTISNLGIRKTQFDIWHLEQNWDKEPMFIQMSVAGLSKKYTAGDYTIEGFFVDSLQVTNRLKINFTLKENQFKIGDSVYLPIEIENPTQRAINFEDSIFSLKINPILVDKSKEIQTFSAEIKPQILIVYPHQKINTILIFKLPQGTTAGAYSLGIGCRSIFGTTLNSSLKKITVN